VDFNGWFVNGVERSWPMEGNKIEDDHGTGISAKNDFRYLSKIRIESPDNHEQVVFFVEGYELIITAPFGAAVFSIEPGGGGGFRDLSLVNGYPEFESWFRTGDKDKLPELWEATKAMLKLTAHADANYFKEENLEELEAEWKADNE